MGSLARSGPGSWVQAHVLAPWRAGRGGCTMACLLGPGGQVQLGTFHEQRAQVRGGWEVGWERSHKALSVSPSS